MAEGQYGTVSGSVQAFPDKPIIAEREVSGQTVREFTIRSAATQQLARITIWPEFDEFTLAKGQGVTVDGLITVNEVKGTTYRNVSATSLSVDTVIGRTESGERTTNKKKSKTKSADEVAF